MDSGSTSGAHWKAQGRVGGSGGPMVDKSPHRTNDKKRGKTLQEKRAAKRQKRAERQAAERARDISEGL
jgi:hypothetical protein